MSVELEHLTGLSECDNCGEDKAGVVALTDTAAREGTFALWLCLPCLDKLYKEAGAAIA